MPPRQCDNFIVTVPFLCHKHKEQPLAERWVTEYMLEEGKQEVEEKKVEEVEEVEEVGEEQTRLSMPDRKSVV